MAKDFYHDQVKRALEKDGWKVTDDPYLIGSGKIKYQIDLGAERIIEATKDSVKIAVEVKSFVGLLKSMNFIEQSANTSTILFYLRR